MLRSATIAVLLIAGTAHAEPIRIITLGDSITKGVRPGVTNDETFSTVLQKLLKDQKIDAEVINVGIGGEMTNQALKRLEKDVLSKKPTIVAIMYGHNDSHFDTGKTEPRLSIADFEKNLRTMLDQLQKAGIKPILMTPPRGGVAWKNGNGVNPNDKLNEYADIIRKIAADTKTPLIDHYAHWLKQEKAGVKLGDWTTDQYHPNPRGHRELADVMLPVVRELLK